MRQMQLNAVLRSTGTSESSQGDMAEFRPKSAGSETSVRSWRNVKLSFYSGS